MRARSAVLAFFLAVPLAAGELRLGEMNTGIAAKVDPTQTYTLYLPTSYDPEKKWPLLFVFDPRGRSVMAAEIFRDAAERHGWVIASSDNTRSDGPWDPNIKAVNAMWDDLPKRARIDIRRVYATGFSGGAMLAWVVAQSTQAVTGIISSGGRLPEGLDTETIRSAHYGSAGIHDFNYLETKEMDVLLEERGAHHRFESFPGRHEWLPEEQAAEAMRWLEVLAMKNELRPLDLALVEEAFAHETEKAAEAERNRHFAEAAGRYRMIARTFEGLMPVGDAQKKAAELAADRRTKAELKEAQKWDLWEKGRLRDAQHAIALLAQTDTRRPPRWLASELNLSHLKKRAKGEDYEAHAAQRVLESLFTQLNFYLPREFWQRGRFADAVTVLEVATEIHDMHWTRYNLAAAYARLGDPKRALAELRRAMEMGYSNAEHLAGDEDFVSLRDTEAFQAIVSEMKSKNSS